MPRRIHLIGKKRGDRRSVPRWMGSAGEMAFLAALLGCGLASFFYLLAGHIVPQWFANRNFVETTCQVLEVAAKPEGPGSNRYRPQVKITYTTDGEVRGPTWTYDARMGYDYDQESARELAAAFEPHTKYRCWYNPINPAYVIVVRDVNYGSWILLLVSLAVTTFAGYKLLRTLVTASHSVERRAHVTSGLAPAAGRPRRGRGATGRATEFPAVPSMDDIINSPGTHLAYRLPSDGAGTWRIGGVTAMAAFFGLVLTVFLSSAIPLAGLGLSALAEAAFILPFVVVQVVLTVHAVKVWLRSTKSGSSRLEVSEHPLLPGETYSAILVQTGQMKVRRLEVQLICQEEATYSPGTDTRVAREIVRRDILWRRDFLEIRPGAALEAAFDVPIPDGAMHSFVADHNRVDWYLLVRIRTAGSGLERRFPVCVYPRLPSLRRDSAQANSYLHL
jgi:hypothetical protein